ncbi:MAG: hypothetical protein ISQ32_03960 [Rickettsiales bacterium]|nr:hypothetical protein [Rickettsiales bacterium]
MTWPNFPSSEHNIKGFLDIMEMKDVAVFLYERHSQSDKNAFLQVKKQLDSTHKKKVFDKYQENLKLLNKTIDENPDGFFVHSIVNMIEFYADNILTNYSAEIRRGLYPEFGSLLVKALTINLEQQRLLTFKFKDGKEVNEYWNLLKTRVGVLNRPCLKKESQEHFSLRIDELTKFCEIIFSNDLADHPIRKKLETSEIQDYKFLDFSASGQLYHNTLQGNITYINEFLNSKDIKEAFSDIKSRAILYQDIHQTSESINTEIFPYYNNFSQLRINNQFLPDSFDYLRKPSGITQEKFQKWVQKYKPVKLANINKYVAFIHEFSFDSLKASIKDDEKQTSDDYEFLDKASESVNEKSSETLVKNTSNNLESNNNFANYVSNKLHQTFAQTNQIISDNKQATLETKKSLVSRFVGFGILNFLQFYTLRYSGNGIELKKLVDDLFEFSEGNILLRNNILTSIHLSINASKLTIQDESFIPYKDNFACILTSIIEHEPLYLFTSNEYVEPLYKLFFDEDLFQIQKKQLQQRSISLIDSDKSKIRNNGFLTNIIENKYFKNESSEPSYYDLIKQDSNEIAELLIFCFNEKLLYNINYYVSEFTNACNNYLSSRSSLQASESACSSSLAFAKKSKKKEIEDKLNETRLHLMNLENQFEQALILFNTQNQSMFANCKFAFPHYSVEIIESSIKVLRSHIESKQIKDDERLRLQYLLCEIFFSDFKDGKRKISFLNTPFRIAVEKGSKQILNLINEVKIDSKMIKFSEAKFKIYCFQQAFITLLSGKNFDNLNYLYSLDEGFFHDQFKLKPEDSKFVEIVQGSLLKLKFDEVLSLLQNVLSDAELGSFFKQKLIFNENIFSRFNKVKSYFADDLIISSFFSGDDFEATKFIQYIAEKKYDALFLLNAIADTNLKAKLFNATVKYLEENDPEVIIKLAEIDGELLQQYFEQNNNFTPYQQIIANTSLLTSLESALKSGNDSSIDVLLLDISKAFNSKFLTNYLFGSDEFKNTKLYDFLIAGSKEVIHFFNETYLSNKFILSEFRIKAFSVLLNEGYYESLETLLTQNLQFFESEFKENNEFREDMIVKVNALNIDELTSLKSYISSESFLKKLINLNISVKTVIAQEEFDSELDQNFQNLSLYHSDEISKFLQIKVDNDECRPLCYDLIQKGSKVILPFLCHLENNQSNRIFLYGCFHELIKTKRFDDLEFFCNQNKDFINNSFELSEVVEEFNSKILANLSKDDLLSLNNIASIVPNIKATLDAHIIKLFSDDIILKDHVLHVLDFYKDNFLLLCGDYIFNKKHLEDSRFLDVISSNEELALILFKDFCQDNYKIVIGEELLLYFLKERNFENAKSLLINHSDLFDDILIGQRAKFELKAFCDNLQDPDIKCLREIASSHENFDSLIKKFLNPLNREILFLKKDQKDLRQFFQTEKAEFDDKFNSLKATILAELSKDSQSHSKQIQDLKQEIAKEKNYNDEIESVSSTLITDKIKLKNQIKELGKANQELGKANQELEKLNKDSEANLLQLTNVAKDLAEERKKIGPKDKKIDSLQVKLRKSQDNAASLGEDNERMEKLTKALSNQNISLKQKNLKFEQQIETYKEQLKEKGDLNFKHETEIKTLQRELQERNQERDELKLENSKLNEEIKSLNDTSDKKLKAADCEIIKLKQELENQRKLLNCKSVNAQEESRRSQRLQNVSDQGAVDMRKLFFKQQFYSFFQINYDQNHNIILQNRFFNDGMIQGFVDGHFVAQELRISYNAGDHSFFPIKQEFLEKQLDEYFSKKMTRNENLDLIKILPYQTNSNIGLNIFNR